jgi:hypothetical protein
MALQRFGLQEMVAGQLLHQAQLVAVLVIIGELV